MRSFAVCALLDTYTCALTFTYTVNMSGNLTIQVSWTRPSQTGLGPGNAYQMIAYEMMVDGSCYDNRLLTFPETQTSVTFSDVVEGCKYVFRVRGQNNAGYGHYQNSSEVRVTGHTLTATRSPLHARTHSLTARTHAHTLTCAPIHAFARANAGTRTCMYTAVTLARLCAAHPRSHPHPHAHTY